MTYVPASGTPTENGAALQAAITAASYGDTITLDAGGVYEGNVTLPNKGAGSAYITIESTAMGALPDGVRVNPSQIASFPTVRTGGAGQVFFFANSSHHYRLRGLEITTSPTAYLVGQNQVLVHGGPDLTNPALAPHDIVVDRCLIHPYETDPLPWRSSVRACSIDGSSITYTCNYMWDFTGWEPPVPTGLTVSAATNASPVQVTFSGAHGLPAATKHLVTLAGATGTWTGLNGTKVATYVSTTQVTLQDYDPNTFALSNVNTLTAEPFAGQTVTRMSQVIVQSQGIMMTLGPGPYLIHNNFIESYYTNLWTGGGAVTHIPPENVVTVTAVVDVGTVALSGLGDLAVDDLIAFKYAEPQAVTAAAATNPCRLTVATHRYPAGAWRGPEYRGCYIKGATGEWTDINSSGSNRFWGKIVDATHIDLYVGPDQAVNLATPYDATGHTGALTGTVTWVPESSGGELPEGQTLQWQVGKVTSINTETNVITYDYQGHSEGQASNGSDGNGAGVPVAVDSPAQFNGICVHDITVTRNTLSVRWNWLMLFMLVAGAENYGAPGTNAPKGVWESKNAVDVLIEGNIVQVNGGVLGTQYDSPGTVAINTVNQSGGTPWMENRNWVIRNNVFVGFGYTPISHAEEYESGMVSQGFTIENNVYTRARSNFLVSFTTHGLVVRHNTIQNYPPPSGTIGWSSIIAIFNHSTGSVFKDNVVNFSTYGYQDFSTTWAPDRANNYLIDTVDSEYFPANVPAEDVAVASTTAMKFVDLAAGDAGDWNGYQLAADSPGKNAATDGGDVGANFATLNAALSGEAPAPSAGRRGGAFFGHIFRTRY